MSVIGTNVVAILHDCRCKAAEVYRHILDYRITSYECQFHLLEHPYEMIIY